MNGAHLHLLLNHLPVVGSIFTLCLLVYGILLHVHGVIKPALVSSVVCALLAIPVYLTGEEAENVVESLNGIDKTAMEHHQESAEIALWAIGMCGAISLGTLASSWKKPGFSGVLLWMNVAFLVVSCFFLIRAAYSGGQIHHPEIRNQASAIKNG